MNSIKYDLYLYLLALKMVIAMQRKATSKQKRKGKTSNGVEILDNHDLSKEILISANPCDFEKQKVSHFIDARIEKDENSIVATLEETHFSKFTPYTTLTYAGHAFYASAEASEGVSTGSRRRRNAKQERHYAHRLLGVYISEIAKFATDLLKTGDSKLREINLFGCYTAVTPRKDMDFSSYTDNNYSLCEALCLSLNQYNGGELPQGFTVKGALGAVTFGNGVGARVRINGAHYNMVETMDLTQDLPYTIDKSSGFVAIDVNKFTSLWEEKTGRKVSSWEPTLFKPTKKEQQEAESYAASAVYESDNDSESEGELDNRTSGNMFALLGKG